MTMRAYKVKKCGTSRKSVSNSCQSNNSSSRVNEELNPEERTSNSNVRDVNSSI